MVACRRLRRCPVKRGRASRSLRFWCETRENRGYSFIAGLSPHWRPQPWTFVYPPSSRPTVRPCSTSSTTMSRTASLPSPSSPCRPPSSTGFSISPKATRPWPSKTPPVGCWVLASSARTIRSPLSLTPPKSPIFLLPTTPVRAWARVCCTNSSAGPRKRHPHDPGRYFLAQRSQSCLPPQARLHRSRPFPPSLHQERHRVRRHLDAEDALISALHRCAGAALGNCLRAFAGIPYSPGVPSIYYKDKMCESQA